MEQTLIDREEHKTMCMRARYDWVPTVVHMSYFYC